MCHDERNGDCVTKMRWFPRKVRPPGVYRSHQVIESLVYNSNWKHVFIRACIMTL